MKTDMPPVDLSHFETRYPVHHRFETEVMAVPTGGASPVRGQVVEATPWVGARLVGSSLSLGCASATHARPPTEPHVSVVVLIEGVADLTLEGTRCRLHAGQGAVLCYDGCRAFSAHHPPQSRLRAVNLTLMSSGWAALGELTSMGVFPAWRNRLQAVPILPGLCLSLSEWLDTGQSDRTNMRIDGLARQLAVYLEPFVPVVGVSASVCPRLLALRQHLETHWQVPHSLEALAQRACMSSSTLRSRFRAAFGYSVFGYLREVRLQRAHELLMSGASVQRVSEVAGYGHVGNFSTAYRRRFGHAPTNARPAAHRT